MLLVVCVCVCVVIKDIRWDQSFGSSLHGMCVSAHRAARTPWVPVSALYPEHNFCFDAVTNSSVTQRLPSQLTVQSCLLWPACHLPLMSCLFLKRETVAVYKKQIIKCVANIKNNNHVVRVAAKIGSQCVNLIEAAQVCLSQIRIDGDYCKRHKKPPFRQIMISVFPP